MKKWIAALCILMLFVSSAYAEEAFMPSAVFEPIANLATASGVSDTAWAQSTDPDYEMVSVLSKSSSPATVISTTITLKAKRAFTLAFDYYLHGTSVVSSPIGSNKREYDTLMITKNSGTTEEITGKKSATYTVQLNSGDTLTIKFRKAYTAESYQLYLGNFRCVHVEETDRAVAPTCTETGLTAGSHCRSCGEVLTAQTVVPAKGHNAVIDEAVEPDCLSTGLTEGSHCSVCGEVLVAQDTVPALGHSWDTITVLEEPTCDYPGIQRKTCSRCDAWLTEEIDQLNHEVIYTAAVEATCTEPGMTKGEHCDRCGKVFVAQEVIPAGHIEIIDEAVAAVCRKEGLTEGKHCGRCGEVLVAQKVIPAGHIEIIDEAVEPDCEESGWTEGRYCERCGETLSEQEMTPALGHKTVYISPVDPTCAEPGMTEGTYCSRCDKTLWGRDKIPATHVHFIHSGDTCDTCGGDFSTGKMQTLKLPAALTAIESEAFSGISAQAVVIPETCTRISADAFTGCPDLIFVRLPIHLKDRLPASAFSRPDGAAVEMVYYGDK